MYSYNDFSNYGLILEVIEKVFLSKLSSVAFFLFPKQIGVPNFFKIFQNIQKMYLDRKETRGTEGQRSLN